MILALGLTLLTHSHCLASHKVPQSENHSLKLRMNSQIGFFSNQVSLTFFFSSLHVLLSISSHHLQSYQPRVAPSPSLNSRKMNQMVGKQFHLFG